jgi:hypothetical protein
MSTALSTLKVTLIPSFVTQDDFARLMVQLDGCLQAKLLGRQAHWHPMRSQTFWISLLSLWPIANNHACQQTDPPCHGCVAGSPRAIKSGTLSFLPPLKPPPPCHYIKGGPGGAGEVWPWRRCQQPCASWGPPRCREGPSGQGPSVLETKALILTSPRRLECMPSRPRWMGRVWARRGLGSQCIRWQQQGRRCSPLPCRRPCLVEGTWAHW